MTLTEAFYVPRLHNSLISVPNLIEKGFTVTVIKEKCLMESKQGPLIEFKKWSSFCISVGDRTNLWHQRFGHLRTKAIVAMSKKEVVLEIPKVEENESKVLLALAVSWQILTASLFDHCYKSCQRIHMESKDPMEVAGIEKFDFFLIVVNDYSDCTYALSSVNRSKCDNSDDLQDYLGDQSAVLDEIPDNTPELNGTGEETMDCHEHDHVYAEVCRSTSRLVGRSHMCCMLNQEWVYKFQENYSF